MRALRTLFLVCLLTFFVGGVCEAAQITSQPITVTNTTTTALTIPSGQGLGLTLQIDVSAIGAGDTWTFKAQWVSVGGTASDLTTTSTDVTSTGVTSLTLTSPYGTAVTTPLPTQIVATRSVAGGAPTITYRVIARFINYLEIPQTISSRMTYTGGIDVSGSSGTVDLGYDYSFTGVNEIADPDPPTAPTAAQTATTGGTCSSANTYRFYMSWENKSGKSIVSAASSPDASPTTTTARWTVTRPTAATLATTWDAWFSSSADAHATLRGCAISGSETNTAIATTTAECRCSTASGTIRAPSVATARRINGSKFVQDHWERPEGTTLEVCDYGCQYQTIQAALDTISDSAITKQYVIYVRTPYTISSTNQNVSLTDPYVHIVGEHRGISVGNVLPGVGANENILQNLTFYQVKTASGLSGATIRMYGTNCWQTSPTAPVNIDCWYDEAGGNTGIGIGNDWISNFDTIATLGGLPSYWIGAGNKYTIYYQGTNTTARCWAVAVTTGGSFTETGSSCTILTTGVATDTQELSGLLVTSSSSVTAQTVPMRVHLTGVDIDIKWTVGSRSAVGTGCYSIKNATAGVSGDEVIITDSRCSVSSDGTEEVFGLKVEADADHADWTTKIIGGEIALSGGGSRYDVDNAETQAGFALTVSGTLHSGSYTGAGTTTIRNAPLTSGVIRNSPLAAAPATCSIGDRYIDTSGADCACKAANTWEITNATGACT